MSRLLEAARAQNASWIHAALATGVSRLSVLENIAAHRRNVVAGLQLGHCLFPSRTEDKFLDDVNDSSFRPVLIENASACNQRMTKFSIAQISF